MTDVLQLLAVLLLVAMNGFFVAAEFALVSVRKSRIDQLVTEGVRSAKAVQRALTQLDTYIAATQLGITMASIALGFVGEPVLAGYFQLLFSKWLPEHGAIITAHTVSIFFAFSIVTALHIVLGELVPKSIALQRPEATTLVVTAPLDIYLRIFRPFINGLNGIGNGVLRMLGYNPTSEHGSVHSTQELEILLHHSREAGIIEEHQEQMVAGVFDFEQTPVRKLMTPRLDIVGVEETATLQDLLRVVRDSGHSRILVYNGDLDNLCGVIHVKDALDIALNPDADRESITAKDLAKTLLSIPDSKRAGFLLNEFRRTRSHIAAIRDEYGTVVGVVTIEDLIEEIVGEIQDEYDTEEPEVRQIDDRTFSVDARMSVTSFNEMFEAELSEDEGDTIGGFVFSIVGHQPVRGERAQAGDITLMVESTDGHRVLRVRATVPRKQTDSEENQTAQA
jgi:CBS domain containing-hemolysin-like protein